MEELIQNEIDKKKVQSLCKKILKKCSFNSERDLGNITDLATWLYIYGEEDKAVKVCELLENMEFTGNYNLWDAVDMTQCLKARICRFLTAHMTVRQIHYGLIFERKSQCRYFIINRIQEKEKGKKNNGYNYII